MPILSKARRYSRKNTLGALVCLIVPFVFLFLGWMLSQRYYVLGIKAILRAFTTDAPIFLLAVFFAYLGITLLVPGIVLFFLLLGKKDLPFNAKVDARSGKDDRSTVPLELVGWSWGAFGLPLFWGVYHNVWVALFSIFPPCSTLMSLYLGMYGNELAWTRMQWESVEEFQTEQHFWNVWGVVSFAVSMVIPVLGLGSLIILKYKF
jgi:hypothetical protein